MGVLADCEMMYLFIMAFSLVPGTSCQPGNSLNKFTGTSDDWSETRISLEQDLKSVSGWSETRTSLEQDLESASEKPVLKQKTISHSLLSESGIVMQILHRDFQQALHLRTDIPEDTKDQTVIENEDPIRVSQAKSSPVIRALDPLEVNSLTMGKKTLFPKGRNVTRTDTSPSDLLIYILETISKDYNIILLHDNHPDSRSDISSLSQNFKLMIVNIGDPQLAHKLWMGDYNDGLDVHILFFRRVVAVKAFADSMPALLWAPDHLLLINADEAEDATMLLGHNIFSHSPYFTLLQLDQRIQSRSVYEILIYEAFRKGNRVTRRGFVGSPKALLTFDGLFPDRFESFYGYYFHLSSWVDDFPYMVQGKTLEDTYGMCIYMLDEIAERLNFTYKVYELPEDHLWGDLQNGTWRGMIGEVWRGERDFCINVMSLVEDRFHAVDFSVPYFLDSDSFVIKNPLPPPRWSSIIFPFSWVTWMALCMVLLCLPAIFICLNKFKGIEKRDPASIFMDVTKALLRQDSPPITSHLSIRVFIGNWWLMAMILSISYTGNLIAFITIPAKAQKMRTLQEVAESDLTPVMIDYGNFMHSVMKKSGDKTLMNLGEKLQFLPNDDYQSGFDMVEEGKAAFLEGTEYFRYMVILFKAWNTYFLEEVFFPSYVGWIYPKKTAWKHKFDRYLQRFVEAGLPTYWRNKLAVDFRREMNLTRVNSENSSRPLNIVDLQGVFIVYTLCLALSIVVGLTEILACGKC